MIDLLIFIKYECVIYVSSGISLDLIYYLLEV